MKQIYDFIWGLQSKTHYDLRQLSDDLQLVNARFVILYFAIFGYLNCLQCCIIYFFICEMIRFVLRSCIEEKRPCFSDGYDFEKKLHFNLISTNSFPSGHANVTFGSAFFMFYVSPVVGYIGILLALFVCFLRLIVKSHWISDVVFIVIVNFFVWLYIDITYLDSCGINNLLLR